MLKIKNPFRYSDLTPHGRLKKKVLKIAVAILFISQILLDIFNFRAFSHETEIPLLIKNIYLLIPLGFAYLFASRHRDLLKIFTPLYLTLALLVATITFGIKSEVLGAKFNKEVVRMINDHVDFLNNAESSTQIRSRTYSVEEYGHNAIYLNKFNKMMDLYKQENIAIEQAFNELELDSFFREELLFNFCRMVEKIKKFEKLSLFLDESAQRIEDIYSEYLMWVSTSPEVDALSRKHLLKASSTSSDEKKFFRQASYRIQKNIVQECITLLNLLTKIYGNYWIGENDQIIFINDKDSQVWNSHCEMLEKLIIEEENFWLLSQEKLAQASKSL